MNNNIKLNIFIPLEIWNFIIYFISDHSFSSLRNLKSIRITSKLFHKIINKFIYFHKSFNEFYNSEFKVSELFQFNSLKIGYLDQPFISSILSNIGSFKNLEYLNLPRDYNLIENEIKELPTSITSLSLRKTVDFSNLSNLLTLIVFDPFSSKDIKLIPTKLKYLKFNMKEEDWNQQNIDQLPLSINSLIFNNK